MGKTRIAIMVVIIAISIFSIWDAYFRDPIVCAPRAFFVRNDRDEDMVYHLNNDSWDPEYEENGFDESYIFHIYVDPQFTEGDYVYISGDYYDSKLKPKVFINGIQTPVKTSNSGWNDHKYYHFDINKLSFDQVYEILVQVRNREVRQSVIFHNSN